MDGDDLAGSCLVAHYWALSRLTDPDTARSSFHRALDLARQAGDARLVTLMEAFLTVADVRAGDHDQAREAQARLEARVRGRLRQLHPQWAGWMLGLAERMRPAPGAGSVGSMTTSTAPASSRRGSPRSRPPCATWLEGADVVSRLRHTLDLADREGYQAEADCVLVLAYAAICADRPEEAAELVGNALHGRINATKHYAVQRGPRPGAAAPARGPALTAAAARGREHTPAEVLAVHGITRSIGSPRGGVVSAQSVHIVP